MNNLTYILDESIDVQIELLNNKFVIEWLDYFIEIVKRHESVNYLSADHAGGRRLVLVDELISDYNLLANSLNLLSKRFNINFENVLERISKEKINIENNSNLIPPYESQKLLNDIHRIFTRFMNNQNVIGHLPVIDDPVIFENVHNLNDAVHRLEATFTHRKSIRRSSFKNQPVIQLGIQKLDFTKREYIKYRFDPLIQPYDYTVWLNEDILGKDMLRSWLDEDDIHYDDITGNLFQTPNIMLDPFRTIKSIVDRSNWREFYSGTYKTLDRFPLGNIKNNQDWANLRTGKVTKILINEHVIFQDSLEKN